jgi:hypothetical protein
MPEMPTRFAKQLAQIVRDGLALGLSRKAKSFGAIRWRPVLTAPPC